MFFRFLFVIILSVMVSCQCYAKNPSQNIITTSTLNAEIKDFLNSNDHNDAAIAVKKSLPSIVLIHSFSDKAPKSHLIYNGAAKIRETRLVYDHSVISGTIIHPSGYIVTTYDTLKNSSRIIVSINSELRGNNVDSKMMITADDYEAKVVQEIPELNITILKIDSKNGEDFLHMEFGNIGALKNTQDMMLHKCSFAIGKAAGENFITRESYANSKNNFQVMAYPIEKITLEKINGVEYLSLENSIIGTCVTPENAGGAVMDSYGRMIGISDYVKSKQQFFTKYVAIPVNVVKKALDLAVPSIMSKLKAEPFGVTFSDASEGQYKNFHISDIGEKGNRLIGACVESVEKDSIADQSGIKQSDLILKFNGNIVENAASISNMLLRSFGDGSVVLTILRGRNVLEIEVFR